MNKILCLAVAALSLAAADVALADGNVSCPAATRAERKPTAELVQILKNQGWKIRKLQMFNGCYEVYGFDEKGRPVEAFFDPKTLARVAVQP
ncbi:PepSY domain-containing protein [Phenylobacterium ferrooxidans]|uniref:PepSY domain-containing protein n=1 Tax=Phenylobacterium ferrooxidans TaxID=2982689 RepID=A0ABW6CNE4_9CAUL